MKTISLCMIVCNEEEMLSKVLDSVRALVKEIIIVDTGSTDKTKDIAKTYNAKIIDYIWNDDFSDARNLSLQSATCDWILVLDADETISSSDHASLRTLVNDSGADAYSFEQRTYGNSLKHINLVNRGKDRYSESQAYTGWIASRLVRLFRNKSSYRFRYKIHEVIEPSIEEDKGVISTSDVPIHHFTYEKPKEYIDAKLKRYLKYGLKQIEAMPENSKAYLEVAPLYLENKEYDKAEAILQKGILLASVKVDIYNALGTLYLETNRPKEAELVIRSGLSLRKNDVAMLNKLASSCLARQAYEEVEGLLMRARKLSPDSIMTYNNLGLLYAITNRPQKAITALKNTIRLSPANLYALTSLGMLYVNLGKFKNALPILERALAVDSADVRALYHLGVAYDNLNKKSQAIELLTRAQKLQPGDAAIAEKLRSLS